jgi:hypothetical protein
VFKRLKSFWAFCFFKPVLRDFREIPGGATAPTCGVWSTANGLDIIFHSFSSSPREMGLIKKTIIKITYS